jgi:hypothetical protein
LNGITPLTAATAGSGAMVVDLSNLAAALAPVSGNSQMVLIAAPCQAANRGSQNQGKPEGQKHGDRSARAALDATMTRDEQVRTLATDLKIRAWICGLKTLALETAAALRRADVALGNELRALIDDQPGSTCGPDGSEKNERRY